MFNSSSNTMDLKCGVCWEVLSVPCSLSCGHTFCMKCLESIANSLCPSCRAPYHKEKLRKNIILCDIIANSTSNITVQEAEPLPISVQKCSPLPTGEEFETKRIACIQYLEKHVLEKSYRQKLKNMDGKLGDDVACEVEDCRENLGQLPVELYWVVKRWLLNNAGASQEDALQTLGPLYELLWL